MELSTLLITGSVLLLLTGLTVAGAVIGLIFFAPLIILSSPIWVPVGTILFMVVASFLSMCGFGVAIVAVLYSMYRYFRGMDAPSSNWIDYARNRICDMASHVVKDYAREYGGHLQSKVKEVAPEACLRDDQALPAAAELEPSRSPQEQLPHHLSAALDLIRPKIDPRLQNLF